MKNILKDLGELAKITLLGIVIFFLLGILLIHIFFSEAIEEEYALLDEIKRGSASTASELKD